MTKEEDVRFLDTYLSGSEWQGRAGSAGDVKGDGLADESLLVSPVLADYVSGAGHSASTSKKTKSRTGRTAIPEIPEGDEPRENGGSPERVNLGAELQLDASLCPSLGLGSFDGDSDSATEESPKVHPKEYEPVASGVMGPMKDPKTDEMAERVENITDGASALQTENRENVEDADQKEKNEVEQADLLDEHLVKPKKEEASGDEAVTPEDKKRMRNMDILIGDSSLEESSDVSCSLSTRRQTVFNNEESVGITDLLDASVSPPMAGQLEKEGESADGREREKERLLAETVEAAALPEDSVKHTDVKVNGDGKEEVNISTFSSPPQASSLHVPEGTDDKGLENRDGDVKSCGLSRRTDSSQRNHVQNKATGKDAKSNRSTENASDDSKASGDALDESKESTTTVPLQEVESRSIQSAGSDDAEVSFLTYSGKSSLEIKDDELSPIAANKSGSFESSGGINISCDFGDKNFDDASPQRSKDFIEEQSISSEMREVASGENATDLTGRGMQDPMVAGCTDRLNEMKSAGTPKTPVANSDATYPEHTNRSSRGAVHEPRPAEKADTTGNDAVISERSQESNMDEIRAKKQALVSASSKLEEIVSLKASRADRSIISGCSSHRPVKRCHEKSTLVDDCEKVPEYKECYDDCSDEHPVNDFLESSHAKDEATPSTERLVLQTDSNEKFSSPEQLSADASSNVHSSLNQEMKDYSIKKGVTDPERYFSESWTNEAATSTERLTEQAGSKEEVSEHEVLQNAIYLKKEEVANPEVFFSPYERKISSPSSEKPDSCFSEGLQTHQDLSSAKKKLDANSRALLERLRGAAEQRKLAVTRSRDSLAAKEQQQLLALSSSRSSSGSHSPEDGKESSEDERPIKPIAKTIQKRQFDGKDPYQPFKARPLPATTGDLGHGGQIGVPKVSKRQSTAPISPKLGLRRQETEKTGRNSENLTEQFITHQTEKRKDPHPRKVSAARQKKIPSKGDPYVPFRARPIPATTGDLGHGGQTGILKVAKRSPTVPSSPCLGKNRIGSDDRKSMHALRVSRPTQSNPRLSEPLRPPPIKSVPVVKQAALKAKPFQRLPSGKEASHAKEKALREKREREEAEARRKSSFKARPLPTSIADSPTTYSPGLIGLKLLDNGSKDRTLPVGDEENVVPADGSPTKKQRRSLAPPTLHSAAQAEKRAAFERFRISKEKVRQEQLKKERRSLVQKKHTELDKLRESLR